MSARAELPNQGTTAVDRSADLLLRILESAQPVALTEWYGAEWWLGFAYASPIRMPDGSLLGIDRNDGTYPTPHWAKSFVILVDDGDADWPSDKEGRVKWH